MFKGRIKVSKIFGAGFFVGLGLILFCSPAGAVTNLFGYPSGAGGVMSLANSPYVVINDITVNNGNTLTIEPGVIVKMQSGRSIILLNGNVNIGNAENPNPVVITSYRDDAYGGGTKSAGAGPPPEGGGWEYIQGLVRS